MGSSDFDLGQVVAVIAIFTGTFLQTQNVMTWMRNRANNGLLKVINPWNIASKAHTLRTVWGGQRTS